ncbi:type I restriction enzyme HsdR N-terminal domain-containing protein [Treponema zioleckii]|uniref:type I restriction enzyme HsdR N-terminal domain-containing protein n=1 Tax=Treponema zioleckii TaxID=331680 RepID=UPI00168ABD02|nr:type I restriction enzyme HsdR N-terminal domain-containing protein [Treponema zioleckii]
MTYTEAWNKIVAQFNKNLNSKEEIVQTAWELLLATIFNYCDSDIDPQRCVKMGVMTKRADIVIKNSNEDLFVMELKRHTLHEGKDQLFSYLNQLKIDLGILVCDNLYIYDYDFTAKENFYSFVEIPFTQDNPNGSRFVELFSKDNFDKQKIKDFIKESNEKKNSESKIKKELSANLIMKLLKNYFSEKYPAADIEKILEEYNISIDKKLVSVAPVFLPHTAKVNQSFSLSQNFGSKDNTQFMVNGMPTGGKGSTVHKTVQFYVESHTGISFSELQAAFPDSMAKPGFGKMIRRLEEVTPQQWAGSRFNKHPITLSDGTQVAVSTQWKPDNMKSFINGAAKLGIDIKPEK